MPDIKIKEIPSKIKEVKEIKEQEGEESLEQEVDEAETEEFVEFMSSPSGRVRVVSPVLSSGEEQERPAEVGEVSEAVTGGRGGREIAGAPQYEGATEALLRTARTPAGTGAAAAGATTANMPSYLVENAVRPRASARVNVLNPALEKENVFMEERQRFESQETARLRGEHSSEDMAARGYADTAEGTDVRAKRRMHWEG